MANKRYDDIKQFADLLLSNGSYALFCHIHPDGDSIGSAVGLQLMLKSIGKHADVYCSDSVDEKYSNILSDFNMISAKDIDREYDCYVAIDVSSTDRLGKYENGFLSKENTFCIDHHQTNLGIAKYNYIKDCSANAENVLELFKAKNLPLDKNIATALYLGLCTDTGNFTHSNTNPETMEHAAELLRQGVDCQAVNFYAFSAQSRNRAKLYGQTMSKIEYYLDGKLAVIAVSAEALKNCGCEKSDTSGFIDFIMGINGVKVGACLMESSLNCWKVSLRGKGVNVCNVATEYGGGGHIAAAGCTICGFLYDVIEKLVKSVKEVMD